MVVVSDVVFVVVVSRSQRWMKMIRQWAELGAVAIGLLVCMHVRRLLAAG